MAPSSRRRGASRKRQRTLESVLKKSRTAAEISCPRPSGQHSDQKDGMESHTVEHGEVSSDVGHTSDGGKGDESEDDEVVVASQTPRRRNRHRRRQRVASSDDESDKDNEGEDSDDVPYSAARKRRKRNIPDKISEADDASDPVIVATPIGSGRLRSSRASGRSKKGRHLELLRRRRQGELVTAADQPSSSSDEKHVALYDTDSENPALEKFEDEEDEEEQGSLDNGMRPLEQRPRPRNASRDHAHWSKSKPDSVKDEGSDANLPDFIIDDDDDELDTTDAPARGEADIPIEFTAYAHRPLKEHFKDAVEWLVQRRINPSFDMNSPVFHIAWRRLGDEFLGLAVSKFSSSAWNTEFQKSLRARPYLDIYPIDNSGPEFLETCAACNRTNHPATRCIRLTGAPYYQDSLEEISSDSNSEDDGNRDEGGNTIAPDGHEWLVGVVCASNAETAHDLYHWKHSLKDWVDNQLTSLGLLSPEKLAQRERLSASRRSRLAVAIVDEWDKEGIIKALYGDFKRTLEKARNKSTTAGRRSLQ